MAGHVQGIAWSQQEALANLSGMDRASPFLSRLDFVTAVANVAMAHRDEMHRKGPKGVLLSAVLSNAVRPAQCGWYLNNHYHRHKARKGSWQT